VDQALPLLIAAQGVVMAVDEFYAHRRRGLPDFEIWGHPLDTIGFAIPAAIAAFAPYNSWTMAAFITASLLSTLLVTKDEWVHAKACNGFEHWLHAVLFLLHTPLLISLCSAWQRQTASSVRITLPFVLAGFAIYQLWYWHSFRSRKNAKRQECTSSTYPLGHGG
jgi:hypothetical protein